MRNTWEKEVDKQLRQHRPKGATIEYETEKLTYVCQYIPDFIISLKDGRKIYIEAKGWLRPEDKAKMTKVKRDNPDLDIRIVFQKLNHKYTKWAERNNIPWAVNRVPKEWLD